MAGDWIKMRTDLWTDPRVVMLQKLLNCDAASVTGALYRLWSLADQHSENGELLGYDARRINQETGVDGFAEAMASDQIQWLRFDDDVTLIPNFLEHNGQSAKARAQAARRMDSLRSRDGRGVTGASPEKRREEKNRSLSIHDPSQYVLPPQLSSTPARQAFKAWLDYKLTLEKAKRYTSEKGPEMLLTRWAKFGAVAFCDAVERAISNNWQGLQDPKPPRNGYRKPTTETLNPDIFGDN